MPIDSDPFHRIPCIMVARPMIAAWRAVPIGACALLISAASLTGCSRGYTPIASNGQGLPAGYHQPHHSGWNPSSERPAWLLDQPAEFERERNADDGYSATLG